MEKSRTARPARYGFCYKKLKKLKKRLTFSGKICYNIIEKYNRWDEMSTVQKEGLVCF